MAEGFAVVPGWPADWHKPHLLAAQASSNEHDPNSCNLELAVGHSRYPDSGSANIRGVPAWSVRGPDAAQSTRWQPPTQLQWPPERKVLHAGQM
ncbi:hypothetical protein D3C80_1743550 [compost metagenome]